MFEQISRQKEYYLTDAEIQVLRDRAGEIAALTGSGAAVFEFGGGSGDKTGILLDALRSPSVYVPIDISRGQLLASARRVAELHPDLRVQPLHSDYSAPLQLPRIDAAGMRLAYFPGSTIGNFLPAAAATMLARIRAVVDGGAILLGVDRMKNPALIEAAYNDRAGHTAAFNLNVLERLNRELGANFDLGLFAHEAAYNTSAARVEMHLVSVARQTVTIGDAHIELERGEKIRTACSYKYNYTRLTMLAAAAGLAISRLWTDRRSLFWVALLRPE